MITKIVLRIIWYITHRQPNRKKLSKAFNIHISPLLYPIGDKETLAEYKSRLVLGACLTQYHLFAVGADKELNMYEPKDMIQFNPFILDEDWIK
jgi:hypothetical protein